MTAGQAQSPRWLVWTRRGLVAAGILAVLYAAVGVLRDQDLTLKPYLRYLVVNLIANDLLLIPAALVAGFLTVRFLPAWTRAVVQGALFVSAAVTVVALPLVLGYGRSDDLPSALPRDYGRNLLIVYAAIWLAAAGLLIVRRARPHTTRKEPS